MRKSHRVPVIPGDSNERGSLPSMLNWVRKHTKSLIVSATAAAGFVYTVARGGEHAMIVGARENAPWALIAYTVCWIVYFSGVAMAAAGVGQTFMSYLRSNRMERAGAIQRAGKNTLIRTGLWINTVGAVAAAVVASVAIIESLPPSAWSTLIIAAADLYSTIVIRSWLLRKTYEAHQPSDLKNRDFRVDTTGGRTYPD